MTETLEMPHKGVFIIWVSVPSGKFWNLNSMFPSLESPRKIPSPGRSWTNPEIKMYAS